MRRLDRKRSLIVILVLAVAVAAAIVAAVLVSGGHGAQATLVAGGDPAVGRSFASLTHETNVSCLDTHTKNVSDNNPVYVCTGTYKGKDAPCRPIAWNGRDVHYVDFWSNAFDNGNGAVTC